MMERRLLVAKELLKPFDSFLVCSIDEDEVHRLALLLEQIFSGSRIQMITTVINPKGASLGGDFSRVEEHLFVIYFGSRVVAEVRDMLDERGNTPNGDPIKGEYKFIDEFPIAEGLEENAEFFTLTYEARNAVNHNLAYARIAPLLWLRAGASGHRIDKLPAEGWAVADTYGLLTEVDQATPFIHAMSKANVLRVAYIVTDDDRRFQSIAKRLPDGVEPVRLYESYLTNFSFANGE